MAEPSFKFKWISEASMHYCFTVKAKKNEKLPFNGWSRRSFYCAMQQNKHYLRDKVGGSHWFCLAFFHFLDRYANLKTYANKDIIEYWIFRGRYLYIMGSLFARNGFTTVVVFSSSHLLVTLFFGVICF